MNTRQERHEEAIDPVAADWLYRSESTEAGLSVSRMAADADRIAREIDRQILDDRPVPEILQWLCGQVAGTFDCPMVWVGLRENSGRISVQAKHGPKASILDSLELRWDDCPAGRGPAGRAIRTGHPQKAVFFRDECLRTWESAAAEYQFKVVYAVPLVAKGSTLGVMGFHCHSDDHYHAVSPVLNRFADRVALSLLHGQARDTIRLQDAVLESMTSGIAVADEQGVLEWVNPAFAAMTGFEREELIGSTFNFGHHGMSSEEPDAARGEVLSGRTLQRERLHRRKDQTPYLVSETIVPVIDPAGSVSKIVAIHHDITDRRKHESQVRHMARCDLLTNLPNRQVLEEALEQVVNTAQGDGAGGALLLLDLDQFRVVNDTLGHATGDRMLIAVASVLTELLGPDGFLARWGGDEFAVLLQGSSRSKLERQAKEIQTKLADYRLSFRDTTFSAGCSVGIAIIDGRLDAKTILSLADAALYEAKDLGAGRVVVMDGMSSKLKRELNESWQYATLIRDAVKQDKLVVYYQPIVRIEDETPQCFEALVRMRRETEELVQPGTFIPVAERYGLVSQVDNWVLREVLKQIADRPDRRVFVNLSGALIGDNSHLQLIEGCLAEYDILPGQIVIEVTEQVAVRDLGKARRWMSRLRKAGCRFALDDFGTGFSTFSYLKALPVDYVKIDRSFVSSVESDPASKALVQAVVAVARALDKHVIAEGVENRETVGLLRDLGVGLGQGFYWGIPGAGQLAGVTN